MFPFYRKGQNCDAGDSTAMPCWPLPTCSTCRLCATWSWPALAVCCLSGLRIQSQVQECAACQLEIEGRLGRKPAALLHSFLHVESTSSIIFVPLPQVLECRRHGARVRAREGADQVPAGHARASAVEARRCQPPGAAALGSGP